MYRCYLVVCAGVTAKVGRTNLYILDGLAYWPVRWSDMRWVVPHELQRWRIVRENTWAIEPTCHCDTPSSLPPSAPSPSPVPPNASAPNPGLPPLVVKVSGECAPTSSLVPVHYDTQCQLSPHYRTLTRPIPACSESCTREAARECPEEKDALLMFPNTYAVFVEPVAHYNAHAKEVINWAESTGGEVALDRVSDR